MIKTVTVIHTIPFAIEPLSALFVELLPEVRLINILDDSVLKDVMKAGGLTVQATKRICQYAVIAEEMGSDLILNACSSIGETVDIIRKIVKTPVIRIDYGMAEKAIEIGTQIGVLATVQTTLEPTSRLIQKLALEKSKKVYLESKVCEGAFKALSEGKSEEHDRILTKEIEELAKKVDVIVLAQASMARVLNQLERKVNIPVLSSPRLGVLKVKEALGL